MIGVGASVYPQAIQRIYAAGSADILKKSLAGMAVLPLFAVVVVLALGFVAIARYPGLEGSAADQVMVLILRDVLATGWLGQIVVTLLLGAILAALMSTADSALLSLSAIFAKMSTARTCVPVLVIGNVPGRGSGSYGWCWRS